MRSDWVVHFFPHTIFNRDNISRNLRFNICSKELFDMRFSVALLEEFWVAEAVTRTVDYYWRIDEVWWGYFDYRNGIFDCFGATLCFDDFVGALPIATVRTGGGGNYFCDATSWCFSRATWISMIHSFSSACIFAKQWQLFRSIYQLFYMLLAQF